MRLKKHQRATTWFVIGLSVASIALLIVGGFLVFEEFFRKAYEGVSVGVSLPTLSRISESDKPITLFLDLQSGEEARPSLVYRVGNAVIIPKNLSSETCIYGVFVRTIRTCSSEDGCFFEVDEPDYSFDNVCVTPDANSTANSTRMHLAYPQERGPATFQIFDTVNERFFPFDEWSTPSAFLWLDIRDNTGQPLDVETDIVAGTALPDWEGTPSLKPVQITVNGQKTNAYQVDVALHRLISIRFLTILLIFLSAFAIACIPFIKDQGTTIEVMVAILLGLWGIQGVLVPSHIQVTTVTHLLVTLLYVFLVVMACLRLILIPSIRKLKGDSGSSSPS